MLEDIRETDEELTIHCTARTSKTNMMGTLPKYGKVWYYPEGIANILSLKNAKKRYRITYDSDQGDEFIMDNRAGKKMAFGPSEKGGLYYHDMNGKLMMGTTLVTPVEEMTEDITQ